MKFFMIGDLHLGKNNSLEDAKSQLVDLCGKIRAESYPKEMLLFIIMGDIIHASDITAFEDARVCLDCIREELTEYEVRFEFVPGNHDLPNGDINPFNKFIAEYNPSCSYGQKSTYSAQYEKVNFIFADSNLLRQHDLPGKLDIKEIKSEIKGGSNLLFCHHGFEQNYGGDHDTVECADEVLKELKQLGIDFVFHGHTHRAGLTVTRSGIIEIGCGTMFQNLDDMKGIQNQFSVGYIQGSKVRKIVRIIVSKDGGDVYPSATLYPEDRTFVDPRTVNQITYDKVSEYIQRNVIPQDSGIVDIYERLFSDKEEITLRDALKIDKKILILSDAGHGKSIEMENLAHKLCEELYYPFLFRLKNYTGTKIEELIPREYIDLSPDIKILLFDGYDELSLDNKNCFEKELRLYLEENKDANIVISSRSNFCKVEKNAESKTFSGFKVYKLCELTKSNIEKYIREQGICDNDFFAAVRYAKVESLLANPFYLTQIGKLYRKNGVLPPKADLMEKLVEDSFIFDEGKFENNLEERYAEIMQLLRKVAFAMQLMQQTKLNDRTEYQELFNIDNRRLLQYSGLFSKEIDNWSFIHNNFREYLAARYLSELSQEEVISYISTGQDIYPSWVNTLGFLMGMQLSWDLYKWIAENSPTALVKYEPDTIEENMRFEVFKAIFLHYEEKHLWFNNDLCDEEQLAHFAEGPRTLDFLLDRISNPVNIVSQYTAIKILRFFRKKYGKKDEILSCLLGCCEKYPQTRYDVCRLAIFTIHQLGLGSKSVTEYLMKLYKDNSNDYIRLGMYEYLMAMNEHNEYVEYFLEGTKYIAYKINDSDNRIGNESFELTKALKEMSTVESISAVINHLDMKKTDFYGIEEIYDVLTEKATELYLNGKCQLYDVILDSCKKNMQNYAHKKVKSCLGFFEKTDTLECAVIAIADMFEEDIHYINDVMFLHPELKDILYSAYVQKRFNNHNAFKNIVERYIGDEVLYKKCSKAILDRSNIQLPEFVPRTNYEEVRRTEWQKYFDMLFSKSSAEKMLSELLDKMDKTDLKINDILDKSMRASWESALRHLQLSIYHFGKKEWLVKDFFSKIVFKRFTVIEAKKILEEESRVVVNDKQQDYLIEIVKQELSCELLGKEVRQEKENTVISMYVVSLIFLAIRYEVCLSEEVLLELTKIPAPYYNEAKLEIKYNYILKYLSEDKVNKCIENNLKALENNKMLLEDHIDYCAEHRCDIAVKVALTLCNKEDTDEWLQWHALEYLYNLYGASYIKEYILPYATSEFLLRIAKECKDIPRKDLCTVLESKYEQNPSYELMTQLIIFSSEAGIKGYVEMVVAEKKIPEKQSYSNNATAAIQFINNPQFLYLLEQLLDVVLLPNFVDVEFWGLRNSLSKAFVNCGKEDADTAIAIVEERLNNPDIKEENIRYCNYIIEDIKSNKKKDNDIPKTINEVKMLLGLG